MSDPNQRAADLKDVVGDLYPAIANTLCRRFFRENGWRPSGPPGSGKVSLLEEFVQDLVDRIQANPSCSPKPRSSSPSTKAAAFMIADLLSRSTSSATARAFRSRDLAFLHRRSRIARLYRSGVGPEVHRTQLASGKIWNRSRDNLPNPIQIEELNPWVPLNMPAIGDLFDMFNFPAGSGRPLTTTRQGFTRSKKQRRFGPWAKPALTSRVVYPPLRIASAAGSPQLDARAWKRHTSLFGVTLGHFVR